LGNGGKPLVRRPKLGASPLTDSEVLRVVPRQTWVAHGIGERAPVEIIIVYGLDV
jgi:hypothetical protein